MASLTELSFNWTGFISAMISNISFTYRSIYSKKAMVIFYSALDCFFFFLVLNKTHIGGNSFSRAIFLFTSKILFLMNEWVFADWHGQY